MSSNALVDSLVYAVKPNGVSARSYRAAAHASNAQSFSPGSTIKFSLSGCGSRGVYLNTAQSYVKLRVTNTTVDNAAAAKAVNLDGCGGMALFERITVLHAGRVVEEISDVATIYSMYLDSMVDKDDRVDGMAVSMGTDGTTARTGAQIGASGTTTLCFPLFSSVLGPQLQKYLPVGMLSAGDVQVEIVLNTAQRALVCAAANDVPGFTIDNFEFVQSLVELSEEGERMVRTATGGEIVLSTDIYRAYNAQADSGTSTGVITVPARFASLKTLHAIWRPQADVVAVDKKSLTGRANVSLSQFGWRIGAMSVPQVPIRSTSEAFMEHQRALHAVGSADIHGSIDATNWAAAAEGTFVCSGELEAYAGKSSQLESGISTVTTPIFFEWTKTANLGADHLVTSVAHADGLIIVANGQLETRF